MTPTTPNGCHCSYILLSWRSEFIITPYNIRACPTAKSAISIISWTSLSPSCFDLPISRDTKLPKWSLFLRSSSPISLTNTPLLGARTWRHCLATSAAFVIAYCISSRFWFLTLAKSSPVAGLKVSITFYYH